MDKDINGALLECSFLYNEIEQLHLQSTLLRKEIGQKIGTGKYQMLQKMTHDLKLLRHIYDTNRSFIYKEYEKALKIKFELLKITSDGTGGNM